MRLALFDLDHTLLDGDSELEWSRFLVSRGLDYMKGIERFYEQYEVGQLDIDEYFAFQLRPHVREEPEQVSRWLEQYLETHIKPLMRERVLEVLREHRASGHELMLISASHDYVAEPIAELFGFEHSIVTSGEREDGRYTGRLNGVPCFQDGKVERLVDWLAKSGRAPDHLEETWFYSDSHNDLPLLEWVDHPVAVTPDDTLRAHAQQRGWMILD